MSHLSVLGTSGSLFIFKKNVKIECKQEKECIIFVSVLAEL